MSTSQKSIIIWLLAGCLLIWAMIVVGGITRLTHSGLSMAKWKISTVMPPLTEEQWQAEFNDYKQTPEYKQVNSYFTIEDYKHIYWWEFIHRLIGRMIGMVFLIPFAFFVYKGWLKGNLLWKTVIIFALGGAQGILGWFMVASGLQDVPHVSHYFLAAHLITAFITFGYSFWVALDLIYSNSEYSIQNRVSSVRKWTWVLLFFVLIQIMYGAFTSGLHAGQFDPTWPKMGNSWIAPEVTSLTPVWRNFLDGVAGVQFIHRYNAYVVVLLVFIIVYKSRKLQLLPTQRNGINFLVYMVGVQFLLGVFTLIYSVPVVLGVLHQTGAFLLFASTLFVLHQWKVAPVAIKSVA
ncbi:MAG TPA: COX15/CtaA family protein [Bacteroidia bacterium]|nr:COX15/CtaA family protein [Bacteroidia bacterium]